MQERLTKTQQKFINTILEAIAKDYTLTQFTQARATGKTFALKKLDEILNANVKDGAVFIENLFLTDEAKKAIERLANER